MLSGNFVYAEAYTARNLAGYYPLSENSGNTVHDKTAKTGDGRIFFAKLVEGDGYALMEFDEPFSWIKLPEGSFNFRGSFTIQCWLRPRDFFGKRFIVSNGVHWMPRGYMFYLDENDLCFDLNTEKGRFSVRAPLGENENWINAAVAYDIEKGTLSLYADGKILKQIPANGQMLSYSSYDKSPCIGAIARGGDCERNEYNYQFRGFMRDLLFYDAALPAELISENYGRTKDNYMKMNIPHRKKREIGLFSAGLQVLIKNEKNEKIPSRIYLKNMRTGKYVGPERLFYRQSGEMAIPAFFYALDGSFRLKLQPGEYEMTVIHGPEYLPGTQSFLLKENENRTFDIQLERFVNMTSEGWYGGDHHLHCGTHGNISADTFPSWDEICRIFMAEGLSFAYVRESSGRWTPETPAEPLIFSAKDFLCRTGVGELRHCCYISEEKLSRDTGFMYLNAASLNGVACSHLYYDEIAGELPFAEGRYVFDFFSHARHSDKVYDLWMRCNNIGLKLPVGAGSDFDANVFSFQGRPPPGWKRVYVKLSELSWENIAEAYRKGAIVASSGPLLLISAEGKGPGETLNLSGDGKRVSVEIKAYAWWGLKKVELIRNGIVVATFDMGNQREFVKKFDIDISESSWIAAKCVSNDSAYFGDTAISSPIYIKTAKPAQIKKDDIDFFLKKLDDMKKKPQYQTPENKALLRKTEDFYRKLLDR